MAMATGLLILLFVFPAVFADDYTVGDTAGWNQGVDYSTWTSGKTFKVGDTLLFSYSPTHGVDVVNKADYDNCAATNTLQTYSGGSTTIPLNSTGTVYFLCPTSNHCSLGMKLAVTVSAAGGTPSGTPPSGGSSPDSPTTPSPPTTTTTAPPPPRGAAEKLYNMNVLVLGVALLLSPVLAFMG